jgi:acyl-coenzyme A thioesterase PaaI-like protein
VHGAHGIDDAATAARRVIAGLLRAGDISGADLAGIAARLNAVADDLDRAAPELEDRLVDMWRGDEPPRHDPVGGPENPIAPGATFTETAGGGVESVVTLGLPYQGPPSLVHGGISALLLDHALGVATSLGGIPCVTAQLTLRYHRPTPLFEPLTITGRRESVDGRKVRTVGTISAGGQVCVSAEGLFISKNHDRPR